MDLTANIIIVGCRASAAVAQQWLAPLHVACDCFEINTPLRTAAFLATIGHESAGLRTLVEDLNYDAVGLANTWWRRYSTGEKGPDKKYLPNTLALTLARNPQAIANNVYANRMGNGAEASGDGWKYRGRGPIQQTGATNYKWCAGATGLDLVNHPELLEQPGAGATSAAWYWSTNHLNALADAGNFLGVSRAVNLGNANSSAMPIGWPARNSLYVAARKALGA